MNALYLTEADVAVLVDMPTTIQVIEEAFRRLGAGEVDNVPRARAKAPGIVLHTMSATAAYVGLVGWKCYTTTASGAQFLVGLYEQQSGQLVALIEANRLGQLRTAATTAVAASWMAQADAHEVGIFGSGWQAEGQLEALAHVRTLKQAFVYSRSAERRAAFANKMSKALGIEVVAVDRPEEAAAELPLVVTATTSREPVFDGHWLSEPTLVCAVGSNWLQRAEIDSTVVRRSDLIVCDSVECCRAEAGDFADALQKGVFDWRRAVNLADVVTGKAVSRKSNGGVALFKSVGMAMEDVALGAKILEQALARGVGRALLN
jgi:ornithine cyclodeaminase/alanine dehydrogenase-like protein (mu-crystallin family)